MRSDTCGASPTLSRLACRHTCIKRLCVNSSCSCFHRSLQPKLIFRCFSGSCISHHGHHALLRAQTGICTEEKRLLGNPLRSKKRSAWDVAKTESWQLPGKLRVDNQSHLTLSRKQDEESELLNEAVYLHHSAHCFISTGITDN